MEVQIPNENGDLKPGMFGRARILFDRAAHATAIPSEALIERQNKTGVFLVEEQDGQAIARFVPVETGLREGNLVQVVQPTLKGGRATWPTWGARNWR